jgi:hypothetical protein
MGLAPLWLARLVGDETDVEFPPEKATPEEICWDVPPDNNTEPTPEEVAFVIGQI